MGAGLRPGTKPPEPQTDPTATRTARSAATSGVMGQKSADGTVANRPPSWVGQGEGLNLRRQASRATPNGRIAPDRLNRPWGFVSSPALAVGISWLPFEARRKSPVRTCMQAVVGVGERKTPGNPASGNCFHPDLCYHIINAPSPLCSA